MISVDDAINRITCSVERLQSEVVHLAESHGRILAKDVKAPTSHPPFNVSSMDGYAIKSKDTGKVPTILKKIGEVPAGDQFSGILKAGEAIRLFTGSRIPDGADTVVIQENTKSDGDNVKILKKSVVGDYIRLAGLDYNLGDVTLKAGQFLTPRAIGLLASMNCPWVHVRRKPRIAILATGNEIVMPGETLGPNQIISANTHALAAAVKSYGGEAINLGVARDDTTAIRTLAEKSKSSDILITTGGASVGDYDLVQTALGEIGLELDFWKIAMRPGKPLIFGKIGNTHFFGLPGNPVSALVCALIFIRPAVLRMLSYEKLSPTLLRVPISQPLGENDERQDYLRATLQQRKDQKHEVTPFTVQDSSMLSCLTHSNCLIVRPPFDPPISAGSLVNVIPFSDLGPVI